MVSKKEVLDYLKQNKASLGLTIFQDKDIKPEDLSEIETYLDTVEYEDDKYTEITPEEIQNISPFLKVFTNKEGKPFVQLFRDFHNKMNFKRLSDYDNYITNLNIFHYRTRAFLSAINSEKVVKTNKPKFNAFKASK